MMSVLCVVDFSNASLNVLRVGFDVAERFKANLTVLFTYRLIQPKSLAITDFRKNVEVEAKANFENLEKKLKVNGAVSYEFRTEIGFLSDRIDAFLKKNPVGLIVMGQAQAETINDHKNKSVTDFINDAGVPVLIVPANYVHGGFSVVQV